MRKAFFIPVTIVLASLPLLTTYSAEWMDSGGSQYNTGTQMEIQGTVEKILPVTWKHGSGTCNGIHLLLRNRDNKIFQVVVGPVWYFRNTISFTEGHAVTIFGSQIQVMNKKYILAKWISSGDSEIYLRNYDGSPFWSNDGGNSKMRHPGGGGKKGGPPGGGGGRGGMPGAGMGGMMQ